MIVYVYEKLKMEKLKKLHPHNGKAELCFSKQRKNVFQLEAEIKVFIQSIEF